MKNKKMTTEMKLKIVYILVFIIGNLLNAMAIVNINKVNNWNMTFSMFMSNILGNLGIIVILFSLAILMGKKDRTIGKVLLIETIILSVFMIGITIYYGYYKMFPSFYNLKAFRSESNEDTFVFLIEALVELVKNTKMIYGTPILVIIFLYVIAFRKKQDKEYLDYRSIPSKKRLYYVLIVFLVGTLLTLISQKLYQIQIKDTWHEDNITTTYGIQSKGVLYYYLGEADEYFITGKSEVSEADVDEFLEELSEYEEDERISFIDGNKIANNSDLNGVFSGKNLLLIQLESESNFLIGLKVKKGDEYIEVTPNLNSLVGKAVYCNNYYTTVGIGNTSDAEFTALTGINPIGSSYTVYEYNDADYETLPGLFSDAGYYTLASHANTGNFYLRAKNYIDTYGFDEYLDKEYFVENGLYNENELIHGWIGDAQFLEYTIDEMQKKSLTTNSSIFCFPITVSNHIPYEIGKATNFFNQKELLFPEGLPGIDEDFTNYLEHASYNDYAIGKAIESLKEKGMADDTVIILYGDHGCGMNIYEMFYEHPEMFINDINPIIEYNDDEEERNLLEQQFLLNIPFFIYDVSESETVPSQVITLVRDHSCLKRTIANLFGLDTTYYLGVDILSSSKTISYNPRNLTMIGDGLVLSGSSGKYVYTNDSIIYTEEEIGIIIDNALAYKDINDKLLTYNIFKRK